MVIISPRHSGNEWLNGWGGCNLVHKSCRALS